MSRPYYIRFATLLLVGCYLLTLTAAHAQTNWTTRPSNTTASINFIAYGNGLFMANNGTTAVLTSPDGSTWTTRPTSATASLRANVFGGGQWVAVGYAGTIVTSPDALSWTNRVSGVGASEGVAGLDLYGIAYGAGLFVVVGQYGLVLTSPNGINWTVRVGTEADYSLSRVSYSNGLFIATGSGGIIRTSPDGITWTTRSSGVTDSLVGITYGNGQYVVVGSDGAIVTSPNGLNWTVRANPATSGPGRGVAFGNGVYVAVGKGGEVLTSFDVINWRAQPAGTTNDLIEVAHNGTVFVATGAAGTINTSVNTPVAPKLPNKQATQGRPFTCTLPAFAGTTLTYSASTLPSGLTFNAGTLIISGTPSMTGLSTVTITATNLSGAASASFVLTVNPAPILAQRVFGTGSKVIQGYKLLPLQNHDQLLIGVQNDKAWVSRLDNEGNTRWSLAIDFIVRLADAIETTDGGTLVTGQYIGGASFLRASLTTGDVVQTGVLTATVINGITQVKADGSVFQTAPSGADWDKLNSMIAMKIAPNGQIEWLRMWGRGIAYTICKADGGNFWLVGESPGPNDSADIQGHHDPACSPSCTSTDIWAVKISPTGARLVSRFYGASSSETTAKPLIKGTVDGGLIISAYVGAFNSDGDFAGYSFPSTGTTIVLLKTGPDGSIQWLKWLTETPVGLAQTTDGGYVGLSRDSDRNGDVRVTKRSDSGTTLWTRTYGGNYEDVPKEIEATADGGAILVAYTRSTNGDVSGNHNTTVLSGDSWVVRVSAVGDILFQRPFGSSQDDFGWWSIIVMPDGTFSLLTKIDGSSTTGDILTQETNGDYGRVWIANFFLPPVCPANTSILAQAGNWAAPSTWACGGIPTATSIVQIKSGHVVNISTAVQAKQVQLESGGKALFSAGGKLTTN